MAPRTDHLRCAEATCRICAARDRAKVWYEAHKERAHANSKAWAAANRKRARAYQAAWTKAHPEEIRAAARRKYAADPVPDKIRVNKRRARKAATGGSCSPAEWRAILEQYRHTCPWCGRADVPLHMDHVLPLSQGGTSNADNLQPLCRRCNSRKHTRAFRFFPRAWQTPLAQGGLCL